MKRIVIILAAIVAALSCTREAGMCNVVLDCEIVSDAMPTRADAINDALKSLNPDFYGLELSMGGTKVRIGEETQLMEGRYRVNLLYHPGNGDNWYGNTEAFEGFYIYGFTCDHPSVYISDEIDIVPDQKHYTLYARYDCCAFVFDASKIDYATVSYRFANITEADMERGIEPYVTWTPKVSEVDNLRIFYLCNFSNPEDYMITLHADGKAISVPIGGVKSGRYYLLDFGRVVNIGYVDWIDGRK